MRAFVLLACLGLSGCASIINGSDEDIEVTSDPPGAQVLVDNVPKGTTPCTIELERDRDYDLDVALPEHCTSRVHLTSSESGLIFGNILFGGVIGAIIDFATGASKTLDPDVIHVRMVRGEGVVQLTEDDVKPPEEVEPAPVAGGL